MRTWPAGLLLGALMLGGCAGEPEGAAESPSASAGGAESSGSPESSESSDSSDSTDSNRSASAESAEAAERGEPSVEPSPSPVESRPAPQVEAGPRITVGDSAFGAMLFDGRGQAIYLFDREGGRPRSQCYDRCAADWPPVLTDGRPVAGRGVRPGLLGTTVRRDGALQVTYNGHPLYFYVNEGIGQVLCHDFDEYGGTWFVVQPDGSPAPA